MEGKLFLHRMAQPVPLRGLYRGSDPPGRRLARPRFLSARTRQFPCGPARRPAEAASAMGPVSRSADSAAVSDAADASSSNGPTSDLAPITSSELVPAGYPVCSDLGPAVIRYVETGDTGGNPDFDVKLAQERARILTVSDGTVRHSLERQLADEIIQGYDQSASASDASIASASSAVEASASSSSASMAAEVARVENTRRPCELRKHGWSSSTRDTATSRACASRGTRRGLLRPRPSCRRAVSPRRRTPADPRDRRPRG